MAEAKQALQMFLSLFFSGWVTISIIDLFSFDSTWGTRETIQFAISLIGGLLAIAFWILRLLDQKKKKCNDDILSEQEIKIKNQQLAMLKAEELHHIKQAEYYKNRIERRKLREEEENNNKHERSKDS